MSDRDKQKRDKLLAKIMAPTKKEIKKKKEEESKKIGFPTKSASNWDSTDLIKLDINIETGELNEDVLNVDISNEKAKNLILGKMNSDLYSILVNQSKYFEFLNKMNDDEPILELLNTLRKINMYENVQSIDFVRELLKIAGFTIKNKFAVDTIFTSQLIINGLKYSGKPDVVVSDLFNNEWLIVTECKPSKDTQNNIKNYEPQLVGEIISALQKNIINNPKLISNDKLNLWAIIVKGPRLSFYYIDTSPAYVTNIKDGKDVLTDEFSVTRFVPKGDTEIDGYDFLILDDRKIVIHILIYIINSLLSQNNQDEEHS